MSKTLKTLKAVDFFGQIAAVLNILIAGIPTYRFANAFPSTLIRILVVLGAWQTLSFLIHLPFIRRGWVSRGRMVYAYCYLLVLACVVFVCFNEAYGKNYIFCMLFIGPAMGIMYCLISYREWRKTALRINQQPFVFRKITSQKF